ncbi:7147_t:CDS:2, partial [Rhizophagus irregularis]
ALGLLNKDKDQIKELLLFEQELQDVHKDDNNTLEDNITSNNRDKITTSIETTHLSTETTSLTPLNLNTKHSISI